MACKESQFRLRLVLLAAWMPLALLSCSRPAAEKKGARGESVPVVTAAAVLRDVPVELSSIGTVEASTSVAIRARVTGELRSVHFTEGDNVRSGELLFTIDPRPYDAALKQAEADLAREKAKALAAEADARRYAELAAGEFVTKQQNEQASAQAQAQAAAVLAAEASLENARLNLEYCRVRAPIDGRTGNIEARPGNLVRTNDERPLVTINQIRPVRVAFSLPEQRLREIRAASDQAALAVVAAPSGAGAPVVGELRFIDNAVDRSTGTVLLKAEFPNEDESLWPGQFVNVRLRLRVLAGSVVVPAPALQTSQKGTYVFVVGSDGAAQMRPVTAGPRMGEDIAIESGLEAGETVVTDGQLRLSPGSKVSVTSESATGGAPRSAISGAPKSAGAPVPGVAGR